MYDVETEQPNETSYWDMLYLARAGVERDNILFKLYRSNIATELHETGKLEYENWDGTKSESAIYYAANALALAMIGEDPTNIDGFNLVDKLVSMDRSAVTSLYYTNLPVILIAATQFDDEITDKTFAEDIIDVLKTEYNNSKWGANWGADGPAMVVAALIDYTDTDPEVKTIVDETVAWLQEQVKADKMTVSNTAEKVLTALSLAGPEAVAAANDSTGKNIVDIVLSFQSETTSGAFTYNGSDSYMATQQGMEAMLAYQRMVDGKVGLYDLSDTPIQQYKQLIEKIDQLPEVIRLEDEATIVALRQLYNSLPAAFQAKVTNIAALEKAEQVIQTLKEVAGSKPDSSKFAGCGGFETVEEHNKQLESSYGSSESTSSQESSSSHNEEEETTEDNPDSGSSQEAGGESSKSGSAKQTPSTKSGGNQPAANQPSEDQPNSAQQPSGQTPTAPPAETTPSQAPEIPQTIQVTISVQCTVLVGNNNLAEPYRPYVPSNGYIQGTTQVTIPKNGTVFDALQALNLNPAPTYTGSVKRKHYKSFCMKPRDWFFLGVLCGASALLIWAFYAKQFQFYFFPAMTDWRLNPIQLGICIFHCIILCSPLLYNGWEGLRWHRIQVTA